MNRFFYPLLAGWLGGFLGNAFLGIAFTNPLVKGILYNPEWQSRLFLDITPQRNIPVSVIGLTLLSGFHGLFFSWFQSSLPGKSWFKQGLVWGVVIWTIYWLFQEWFIYVTLLREPISLALVELVILLLGSMIEGVIIAKVVSIGSRDRRR